MSAKTVSQALAEPDRSPRGLIEHYSSDFATVLPSHVKSATWVRLAQGSLRKGDRIKDRNDPNFGKFILEVAAANNTGVFLAALLDAARQGLEPGTEQYYLTPRKVKGQYEVLGITGYQGYIELMYRAGAISSVIAEVVHENDEYHYQRGVDEVPIHRFKPFCRDAERGKLIGVYAYARMKDGSVSRVVELNEDDIIRIKSSSMGSDSQYSPWVNHPKAMWLKSAVRQLQKWVPTSAEYRRELMRSAAEAQRIATAPDAPVGADTPMESYVDGEVIDESGGADPVNDATVGEKRTWPAVARPGGES
jgi:recombination protein RecT